MPRTESADTISIVLPAYNEEDTLPRIVTTLQGWITEHGKDAFSGIELIIVEDGCTDDTPQISEGLAAEHANVRHLHFDERLGKGRAVSEGFTAAEHDLLCFMDVDSSTDIQHLTDLLQPLCDDTADITVGSRYTDESDVERHPSRDLMSRTYNRAARTVLRTRVSDHQCGFKAMHADVFHDIADEIAAEGWFWDTELLFQAQQHGYRVQEVPITWEADGDSAVNASTVAVELLGGVIRTKGEQVLGERYSTVSKYVRFAVVGGIGAMLNTALLYVLTEFLGIFYMISAILSIETAILLMFFLNNRFTFSSVKEGFRQVMDGIIRSNMVRAVGVSVQIGLLFLLTEFAGIYYVASNILAIVVASIFNFIGEKRFNWQE